MGWQKHMVLKLSRVLWEGEQVASENKIAFHAVPGVLLSPPCLWWPVSLVIELGK